MTRITRHKFNAAPTEYRGMRFASKKEAKYAQELDLRIKAGEVLFYLKQVPFHLPGKVIYRVDFAEFRADETVHFVDVKGYRTSEYRMKKKMVESLYPVKIEES